MQDDAKLTADPNGVEGASADGEAKLNALYVSPIRGGIVVLVLVAVGGFLLGLPLYQAGSAIGSTATPSGAFLSLVLMICGGFILFPAFQFARAIIQSRPLLVTDGVQLKRFRFGFGNTEIAWDHVGEIAIKGVWIILVDNRLKQGKFRRSMLGTKGLWIPAIVVFGGGTATIKFIEAHRPELIEPLIMKVASGRAGRGR